MVDRVEEIRINPRYAQHVQCEFPTGQLKEDGTPIIRKNLTTTSDYLKKLMTGMDFYQGIMPPNCRYIEKVTKGTIVVIEEPPAYRTISVSYPMDKEIKILEADDKIKEYGIDKDYYLDSRNMPFKFTLAMPYVIHLMMFDQYDALSVGTVFLRNARLAGFGDYLLKAPFMNISSDGWICYGDKAGGKRGSLAASIENTIMVFWSATFNSDYTYNYNEYKKTAGVSTFIGWQALSQIDPMFIYNVEWIRSDYNMGSAIKRLKDQFETRAKNHIEYRQLQQLFSTPEDTGIEEQVRRKSRTSKRTARLFYDIVQGLYIDDTFFLHVGDPVQWGKKKAYISSFIGFHETDTVRIIRLQYEDGKEFHIRFNESVRKYLIDGAKAMRFAETGKMKNGTVIKADDIITMKSGLGNVYRKVHFIRHARDGVTEARLGNAFYVLENTEGEIYNIEKPTYQGKELDKEKQYVAILSTQGVPLHAGMLAKFTGIDVTRMGELTLEFMGNVGRSKGYKHTLNMSRAEHTAEMPKLFDETEFSEMPPIFLSGRSLVCMKGRNGIEPGQAWGTPEGIIYDHNYEMARPTIKEVQEHLLSEDGSTFSLRGFNIDVEFKIGDKVVYSDWENPVNMLITRTITAFMVDMEQQSLTFVVSDKDGRLTQIPYITGTRPGSSSNRAGNIAFGRIRKITNKWGRVTAGTKIKATKGYIPHFPKKDVNIIIGFITDTGGDDPLVLCSNCCTLWYSEMMENFQRISIKNKKWPALAHAPIDITKIKTQPGDIVNGRSDYKTNSGWLIHHHRDGRRIKMAALSNFLSYPDTYTFDNYTRTQVRLDCIPNPRISPTEQGKMSYTRAWPNFHGLFMEAKGSYFQFLDDGRSLLHVSDPH